MTGVLTGRGAILKRNVAAHGGDFSGGEEADAGKVSEGTVNGLAAWEFSNLRWGRGRCFLAG